MRLSACFILLALLATALAAPNGRKPQADVDTTTPSSDDYDLSVSASEEPADDDEPTAHPADQGDEPTDAPAGEGDETTYQPDSQGDEPTDVPTTESSDESQGDSVCSGLEDGNVALQDGERCQQKYVSCVLGLAWEMICPKGQLFDSHDLTCVDAAHIDGCSGFTLAPTPAQDVPAAKEEGKKTTLADIPATQAYGGVEVTTTFADIPTTTRHAYNQVPKFIADVPKAKPYRYQQPTTIADRPTTKAYRYQPTTTFADRPTPRPYVYRQKTIADIPTTRAPYYGGYRKLTTTFADRPTTKSYGGYRRTAQADIPTTQASYGGYRQQQDSYDYDVRIPEFYGGNEVIFGGPLFFPRFHHHRFHHHHHRRHHHHHRRHHHHHRHHHRHHRRHHH